MNSSAIPFRRLNAPDRPQAFTLIELLAVMGVIIIMLGLAVPAYNTIRGGTDTTKSAYDVSGTLEQARAYAIANNTYVWVGMFEEDASTTGSAGTGRVIMSVVASKDSTSGPLTTGTISSTNAAQVATQVNKLLKAENIDFVNLSGSGNGNMINRPSVSASNCLISGSTGNKVFSYPLGGASGKGVYDFKTVIQFSPLGDVSLISNSTNPPTVISPIPWIELGLRPARGNYADAVSKNLVAIQLAGVGGQIMIYRP